jgi:hypothetical protein
MGGGAPFTALIPPVVGRPALLLTIDTFDRRSDNSDARRSAQIHPWSPDSPSPVVFRHLATVTSPVARSSQVETCNPTTDRIEHDKSGTNGTGVYTRL